MNTERKNILKGIALGVLLAVSGSALAAWSEPTSAPTGGNVEAPINVGNTGQSKGGNLTINANNQSQNGLLVPFGAVLVGAGTFATNVKVDINGNVAGDKFCNKDGSKCFDVTKLCQLQPTVCQ